MMRALSQKLKRHTRQAGFTLVEMLIYIGLLTLISVSALSLLLTLRALLDEYRADQHLTESAQTVLERVLYDLRSADQIDTTDPSALMVDTPGHLVITSGATVTEFYVSGGRLMVSVNSVELGPLTKETVVVDELRFFPYDNGVTQAVKIQFGLTATVGDATATADFNGTAVLRGTYD